MWLRFYPHSLMLPGMQDTIRVVVPVKEVRVLVLVVVSQYSRNLPCLKQS